MVMPRTRVPSIGLFAFVLLAVCGGASARDGFHKVVAATGVIDEKTPGVKVVADYGTYRVYRIAESALASLSSNRHDAITVRDDMDVIRIDAYPLNTRSPVVKLPPALTATPAVGRALQLVQFVGPIKQQWLDELTRAGIRPIQYIESNAYLVFADAAGRQALDAQFTNVTVETASFETWNDRGRDFDLLVAASSWHWIDPSVGWMRAHRLLRPDGWMAVMGHVVIRVPGMLEGYAETADLHERFAPGNPGWSHPPLEEEVRTTSEGWGPPNVAPEGPFGPTIVRWYPTVQWFDGEGYADLLRSTSLYRELHQEVREPLLDAIADRVRTSLGDRVARSYLCVLRVGPRLGGRSG